MVMAIPHLPIELIALIAEHLPLPKDVFSMRLVSHTVKDIVTPQAFCMLSVQLQHASAPALYRLSDEFAHLSKYVKLVTLVICAVGEVDGRGMYQCRLPESPFSRHQQLQYLI
jgi:hypothetical protein